MLDALAEKFGTPEDKFPDHQDKLPPPEPEIPDDKSNKWGFVSADGTRYDTLTEMLDAQVEKFGFP